MNSADTARVPLDTLQRVELAEGVDVEMRPAGPLARACAYTIDLGIFVVGVIVLALLSMLVGALTGMEFAAGTMLIVYFLLYWGYHVWFEAGVKGATPGKRRMKLRVVAEGGGPPTLGAVMLRNVVRPADFMPWGYLAGLLSCLFTSRFQRLGDLVARTMVVHESMVPDALPAVGAPPLPVVSEPPPAQLLREERGAIVRFMERGAVWSEARRCELAGHASGLTGTSGREAVARLQGIGRWLRDS